MSAARVLQTPRETGMTTDGDPCEPYLVWGTPALQAYTHYVGKLQPPKLHQIKALLASRLVGSGSCCMRTNKHWPC